MRELNVRTPNNAVDTTNKADHRHVNPRQGGRLPARVALNDPGQRLYANGRYVPRDVEVVYKNRDRAEFRSLIRFFLILLAGMGTLGLTIFILTAVFL